ncbi:MAG: hydrogenase expression/formation protein HypE [Candidatus Omnitrophica bacterium]|nr:hydrogenase expression/formation protein HypE [Candidatus Omnitrophota bacterium]
MQRITISHGSGGKVTHELINGLFVKHFKNNILDKKEDSAVFELAKIRRVAFTTDSYVVKPIFFPGGDIGKLAVCGTVNDIAVSGASPKYISSAFIIEEGFAVSDLERIVKSMALWAGKAGVKIVAGDTKVVEKKEADGIFINTSGIGVFEKDIICGVEKIRIGDKIIISGTIGDHGVAILKERQGLSFKSRIESDAAPLGGMIGKIMEKTNGVKFMRDPTRGGVATTLNEIIRGSNMGILIEEEKIPVAKEVRAACELLGLDPLYIANEGKVMIIVDPKEEKKVLTILKGHEYGKNAQTIGDVAHRYPGKVCLKTKYGVTRIIDMLTGEQLPRIC